MRPRLSTGHEGSKIRIGNFEGIYEIFVAHRQECKSHGLSGGHRKLRGCNWIASTRAALVIFKLSHSGQIQIEPNTPVWTSITRFSNPSIK